MTHTTFLFIFVCDYTNVHPPHGHIPFCVQEEYKRMYQQYSQIFSSSHVTTPADDAPLAVDTALANDPSPSKAAMFSPVLTQRKNSGAATGVCVVCGGAGVCVCVSECVWWYAAKLG